MKNILEGYNIVRGTYECTGEILLECLVKGNTYMNIWLILPVVIYLSQRLSHACLSSFILYKIDCKWLSITVTIGMNHYLCG